MNFYLGPWLWQATPLQHWAAPAGFAGLDLRTLPQMGQAAGTPGVGLFCGPGIITDSEYTLVGQGSFYDIKPGKVVKDRIPKRAGYALKGDDLVGIIVDLFTDGADPVGQECVKPLMPGMNGRCVLQCGIQQHNLGMRRGFGHWGIARDLLRRDLKRTILDGRTEAAELRALANAINGLNWQQVNNSSDLVIVAHRPLLAQLRNQPLTVAGAVTALGVMADRRERHYRKVLDFTLEKYRIDKAEWRDLCPQDIVGELDPPEPHATTITDDFTRADGDIIGNQLTWTETHGDLDTLSNQVMLNAFGYNKARAESDLSSDDHYAQVDYISRSANDSLLGPAARWAAAAETHYYCASWKDDGNLYHRKVVTGTETTLATTAITEALPEAYKIECDGSTIRAYQAGVERASVTDTAITGNTRCGIVAYKGSNGSTGDNFEAEDLAAPPGVLYTQLEKDIRGMSRGMYTGSIG